jgi:hypothetical protein
MVAMMNLELFYEPKVLELLHIYLGFLHYALQPGTNRVRNFMSYDRQWLEEIGSEDSHGRTIWSLGYTIWHAPNRAILKLANQLFKQAIKSSTDLISSRAQAYSILGCCFYLNRYCGDTDVNKIVRTLADRLSSTYSNNRADGWFWFEDIVSYANARLPQSLLAAGSYLDEKEIISQGLESLKWLVKEQTDAKTGYLSFVGNEGWYKKGGKMAHFDQQPIEALCILEACQQAYQVTEDVFWRKKIDTAFSWFLGKNDRNECLYDFSTGGCFDGIHRGGLNLNQGAESTLSWLAALHIMYRLTQKVPDFPLPEEKKVVEADKEHVK